MTKVAQTAARSEAVFTKIAQRAAMANAQQLAKWMSEKTIFISVSFTECDPMDAASQLSLELKEVDS